MAVRKSAPKSTKKKPVRADKKIATKRKSAASKTTERARSAGAATTPKATKAVAAAAKSKPVKATEDKARGAKKAGKAAPAPGTEKVPSRARGKATAAKSAAPETPAKRARGKGAAKAAPAAAPPPPARRRSAGPPRTVAVTVGSGIVSKLGRKWNCFQCAASFYDLNRPEPLCPKCGADQRQRPKVTAAAAAHPPAPRKQPRPMAPLLDDEDDGTVRYDEEFDLGVRTDIDDAEQDLFPPGDVEEEDVFGGDEE